LSLFVVVPSFSFYFFQSSAHVNEGLNIIKRFTVKAEIPKIKTLGGILFILKTVVNRKVPIHVNIP